jgi:hypothetical protein
MNMDDLSGASADTKDEGDETRPQLRTIVHPKVVLASLLMSLVMLPVGFLLAAVGVAVLEWSGGAAADTSLVISVAGFAVADFWGGGIVAALTKARAIQVGAAWVVARSVLLVTLMLLANGDAALVVPLQIAIAFPAAWAGARVIRKQASLRREIEAARAADESSIVAGVDSPGAGS